MVRKNPSNLPVRVGKACLSSGLTVSKQPTYSAPQGMACWQGGFRPAVSGRFCDRTKTVIIGSTLEAGSARRRGVLAEAAQNRLPPAHAAEDRLRFMARGNFGERLKRERELREVSLKEVTVATRIGPRYLEALENEDWDKLPGGIFNRGFVRSIARYLGLDEENLLAEYDLAYGEQAVAAPPSLESRIPRPPIWVPLLAVVGVLVVLASLILGGIYGWRRYAAHRAARKSAASSVIPPAGPSQSAKPAPDSPAATLSGVSDPPPAGIPLDLSVSTSAATRVRIVADGTLLVDAEFPAGETRHFPAKEQFEVTAGDSSAVLLELNGQAMPPVGTPGASGTIVLSHKDLRQASGGTPQP